jgi:hypothetical protein
MNDESIWQCWFVDLCLSSSELLDHIVFIGIFIYMQGDNWCCASCYSEWSRGSLNNFVLPTQLSGCTVRCNLGFEESLYSIQSANTTQFTSSIVLVIKPDGLQSCPLYTNCSKGYFYAREIVFPSPLFGICLRESLTSLLQSSFMWYFHWSDCTSELTLILS